jgi:hypothetical protein
LRVTGRLLFALLASAAWTGVALAQAAGERTAPAPPACPPDVKGEAPTVGRSNPSQSLSDKLADSKGVICPPAGVDPDMEVKPPAGGELKVIPPPGSPGGAPNVQPK